MRIQKLIECLEPDLSCFNTSLLVDIGSDLGLLGLNLLSKKLVSSVWNVELSKKSLENSEKLYIEKNLKNFSEFIYSDGFSKVPTQINSKFFSSSSHLLIIVLAGLGATKILSILEKFPEEWLKVKNILLLIVPHTPPLKIFSWSFSNQWKLRKEDYFFYNNKIYPILLFSRGFTGTNLLEKRLFKNYLKDNLCYWKYWDNYYRWQSKFIENKKEKIIQDWLDWYSKVRLQK